MKYLGNFTMVFTRRGVCDPPRHLLEDGGDLGETGPLSQGVQARWTALGVRHMNGVEVRRKRPRGFKKRPRGFK